MDDAAKQIGKDGEIAAASYLEKIGHRILFRNFRQTFGELDLVAKSPDGCLVLIEVKTMKTGDLTPEDQMSRAKIKKFKRIAEFFANSHPELVSEAGWRIDVLALTKVEKNFVIKHYQNIS